MSYRVAGVVKEEGGRAFAVEEECLSDGVVMILYTKEMDLQRKLTRWIPESPEAKHRSLPSLQDRRSQRGQKGKVTEVKDSLKQRINSIKSQKDMLDSSFGQRRKRVKVDFEKKEVTL